MVGVVIAVSEKEKAFDQEMVAAVKRVMHEVSIWLELARRHYGQVWVESARHRALKVLPLLVEAPTDEAFFAGLGAVLTAHSGLHWNRAFIYSCACDAPSSAELVYALGGLANEDNQARHRKLHKALKNDEGFQSLEALVLYRMEHPAPHHRAEDDDMVLDRLYLRCVREPQQRGKPIREPYGYDLPVNVAASASPSDAGAARVVYESPGALLSHDYTQMPNFPIPTTFPFLPRDGYESAWVREMNAAHPLMFALDKPVYAFPLWSLSNNSPQPLGLVLVDMQNHNDRSVKDMCDVTRVLLGMVSDILAFRLLSRRVRGRHKAMHDLFHGRNLKSVWDDFVDCATAAIVGDLTALDGAEGSASTEAILLERLGRLIPDQQSAQRLWELLERLQEKINQLDAPVVGRIPDLGAYLSRVAWGCRERYPTSLDISVDCEADMDGLSLPCDPLVLNDAIFALVVNSVEAAQKMGRKAIVTLRARTRPSNRSSRFATMVEIIVVDRGPGINDGDRDFIFVEGYSSAADLNKGTGLSTIKVQLTAFHGDLQLLPKPKEGGEAFVIRFGLPGASQQNPQGDAHAQATDTR